MKIARALSVKDEKGATSWVASQSSDGTDSRGNLAACESGPEKSRHSIHDVGGTACGLGLLAWSLERSGRVPRGTGGGAPADTEPTGGFDPFRSASWVLSPSGLFIPYDRADFAGIVGGCSGGSLRAGPFESLAGVLGGSDGVGRGGEISTVVTLGVDFVPFNGILCLSFSLVGRLGGRGGRVEGLKAGGTIRSPFMDGVLEADVLAVPFDMPEIDDMFEMVDEMDSVESRRAKFPEGRLGGRAGDGCADGVRGGSRGGGVGLAGFETA